MQGKEVAGYPQRYYFTDTTIDVSSLGLAANLYVRSPSAIIAQPLGNVLQSIAGPLSLGGFKMTAGSVQVAGANNFGGDTAFTGSETFSGSNVHTGLESFEKFSSIRFADQCSGADCGAKINAADADLGSNYGIIAVNHACGSIISSAVTLNVGHKLQFVQGGTWNLSQTITLLDKAGIEGIAPTINEDINNTADPATVLKQTASTNLAQMVLIKGQNTYLFRIALDGNERGGGNSSL